MRQKPNRTPSEHPSPTMRFKHVAPLGFWTHLCACLPGPVKGVFQTPTRYLRSGGKALLAGWEFGVVLFGVFGCAGVMLLVILLSGWRIMLTPEKKKMGLGTGPPQNGARWFF